MARSIKCPHCHKVVKVREEAAGKRVDCPECKKAFRAPQAIATPEKPTEATAARPAAQPPPPPTGRVWYFHLDGRNDGPHTPETVIEQLKTGRLDAKSLVWKEGMGDWKPLAEVHEFRGALSVPPPPPKAKAHPHAQPGRGRDHEAEHEQHAHYSRAKARRDLAIGLWLAGGLGFLTLVVLIVVLNRKEKEEVAQPKPTVVPPPVVERPEPTTKTVGEPKEKVGPQPRPKAKASNEALLANLVADLDRGFTAAIEGHKKANRAPILSLIRKCRSHAEKLAGGDWGEYKDPVDSLVKLLNQGADGMQKTLNDRSVAWGLGEGLDEKMKAKSLELDKYEWISNWQKILADAIKKVKDKGLDF